LPTGQHVRVGEVYVPLTEQKIGEIENLYEHQVRTIESDSNVVVLDAPTGSGKTLAALARVMTRRTPAVFIYPTNSLVRDQVRQISKLLSKLGYSPNIIDDEWAPSSVERASDKEPVDIIHATGETLEKLAGEGAKGSVLERILAATDRQDRMRIVLTNPDTLYLVNSGMYHRHGLISDQLFKFKAIVVDEFHLYSGPTLARLLFMLNEMRGVSKPQVELAFLSATHGDTLSLLESTYSELHLIRAEPCTDAGPGLKKIRYSTHGAVMSQSLVLTDDESAMQVAHDIIRFYDSAYEWGANRPNVKVLAIFSSVTFALSLANVVKEILNARGNDSEAVVKQIHGLIPHSARPDIEKLSEAILIGTSAIEVGVDFDVPFLVMEAHDLASFLQRFGRGGRHAPCEFLLHVPPAMALRLGESEEFSFPDFVTEAEAAFHEFPSYAGFLCSRQAKTILLAMALAGSKTYDMYRKKEGLDFKAAIEYFKGLIEANRNVSMDGIRLIDSIGPLDDTQIEIDLERFPVEVMAKHSFARGTMNNILVKYPGRLVGSTEMQVFAELDVFDVFRLSGVLDSAGNHWSDLPKPFRRRYDEESSIFVAHDFAKHPWPKALIAQGASARNGASVFLRKQTTIRVRSPGLTEVMNNILEKRNLVFFWRGMSKATDYRIPRIYAEEENGALVIGDWALVAQYLHQKQKEEDRQS